jgi:hypothetical protein
MEGNLNIANINPFPFTNPSNCFNGTKKGLENVVLGTALSVGGDLKIDVLILLICYIFSFRCWCSNQICCGWL